MMRSYEGVGRRTFDFNCMAVEFLGSVGLMYFMDERARKNGKDLHQQE